jgi:hypothetical protein
MQLIHEGEGLRAGPTPRGPEIHINDLTPKGIEFFFSAAADLREGTRWRCLTQNHLRHRDVRVSQKEQPRDNPVSQFHFDQLKVLLNNKRESEAFRDLFGGFKAESG